MLCLCCSCGIEYLRSKQIRKCWIKDLTVGSMFQPWNCLYLVDSVTRSPWRLKNCHQGIKVGDDAKRLFFVGGFFGWTKIQGNILHYRFIYPNWWKFDEICPYTQPLMAALITQLRCAKTSHRSRPCVDKVQLRTNHISYLFIFFWMNIMNAALGKNLEGKKKIEIQIQNFKYQQHQSMVCLLCFNVFGVHQTSTFTFFTSTASVEAISVVGDCEPWSDNKLWRRNMSHHVTLPYIIISCASCFLSWWSGSIFQQRVTNN